MTDKEAVQLATSIYGRKAIANVFKYGDSEYMIKMAFDPLQAGSPYVIIHEDGSLEHVPGLRALKLDERDFGKPLFTS